MSVQDPFRTDWPQAISAEVIADRLPDLLRQVLPAYLGNQRWYGEKSQTLSSVRLDRPDVVAWESAFIALSIAALDFESGASFSYFVPFVIAPGISPGAIAFVTSADGTWSLVDERTSDRLHRWVWEGITHGARTERFQWHAAMTGQRLAELPVSRVLSGEQSNTNIAFGSEALVKIFRRVQPGLNPDVELGSFLTAERELTQIPRILADFRAAMADGTEASVGIAQAFLANATDGWSWLGEQMKIAGSDIDLRSAIQIAIRDLGTATAVVHLALASADEPEIRPEPITESDIDRWKTQTRGTVESILARVGERIESIEDQQARTQAEALLSYGDRLVASLAGYELLIGLNKSRVHGDYHLGQTLRRDNDWFILDFEGEPARPLAERRARYSPLKDVAGMLRSLGYARAFATQAESAWTDPARTLERVFLAGYRAGVYTSPLAASLMPLGEDGFAAALRPWIIDKAIYEIAYELDNRPSWLWVPIMSLFAGD